MRTLGIAALITTLLAMLVLALWWAFEVWTTLEDADMPVGLYIAMAGGIVFSLLVGGGLMALVFYSSRRGYDERAAGGEFRE